MLNPTQAVHCSASRTSEPSGRRPQSYCTAPRERYGLVLRDVSCGDPEVSKHRLDHLHPSPLFRVDEIFEEGRPGLLRLLFDPTIFQRFQARYDCTPVACLGKFWTRFCCSGLKRWRRGGFGTASTGSIGSRSQSMSPVMHQKREESLRFKSSPVAVLSLSWYEVRSLSLLQPETKLTIFIFRLLSRTDRSALLVPPLASLGSAAWSDRHCTRRAPQQRISPPASARNLLLAPAVEAATTCTCYYMNYC